jgi:hypothetical protein
MRDPKHADSSEAERERTALVIGGTGMLAEACSRLEDLGFSRVVVPSRRGPAPKGCEWIDVDWRDPRGFGSKLETLFAGPVDLLVVWVHYPYREPIWEVLSRYVAESTAVVEVWSHAGARPDERQRIARQAHSHAVLGRSGRGGEGWLDHHQISEGVADAVERALAAGSHELTIVGTLAPLDEARIRDGLGVARRSHSDTAFERPPLLS